MRRINLTKKRVLHENVQHKLNRGDILEVVVKDNGEVETTKSSFNETVLVRYLLRDRFLQIPINYIETS